MLTQQRLKVLLDYNHETGLFTWKVRSGRQAPGKVAGSRHSKGYIEIMVDGNHLYAHRLAWLYMNGDFPEFQIDHINGIREDNRFVNLRIVTNAQNMQNQRNARSDSASGFLGVSLKNRRWRADIKVSGKSKHIGIFDTPEDAHAAYLAAKALHHPFGMMESQAAHRLECRKASA